MSDRYVFGTADEQIIDGVRHLGVCDSCHVRPATKRWGRTDLVFCAECHRRSAGITAYYQRCRELGIDSGD